MPESIVPDSQEHWLKLKSEDISSTEAAALFGMSSYTTELELYHLKLSGQTQVIEQTDRMLWGNRLEESIAKGMADDYGLKIRKINRYMRHSAIPRMGSSFDYEIVGIIEPEDGKPLNAFQECYKNLGAGILEIKKVDGFIYKQQWEEEEAPEHIEIQVQHQMEVSDREWTIICPLVSGNEIKPFVRLRDLDVGLAIGHAVTEFWRKVDNKIEPEPDYHRDAEFLISLHQSAGSETLTTDDHRIVTLLAQYKELAEQLSMIDKDKDAVKANILELVGDNYDKVVAGTFKLSCGMTKETPPTVITPDMVGQTFGGRKSYRTFRVSASK